MKVALVNCATARELGRGNVEGQMSPLGILYLLNWVEMCRVGDMKVGLVDEKRLQQGIDAPSWDPNGLDVLFYWIRPATVRRSIECAARARAENPKAQLVAIGPGAYGWFDRYTDNGPFDLIVGGGPYKIVEQILRGDVIKGAVTGNSFMPPVRLPEAAARYPIGRVTTSWGAVGAMTFCVLPKMQQFDFRNGVRVQAEIDMLVESEHVKYIEIADEVLFMHPNCREIMSRFSDRKHWGAVLDCRRKHGEMSRVQEAVDHGLRILRLDAFSRCNETLRGISRNSSRREVERAFKYALGLRKDGVEIIVRLLYGLPHQSWDGLLEDINFFEKHNGVYVQLDPLIVHPGTWLWQHRGMSGLVLDDDNMVCESRWMSKAEIDNVRIQAPMTNQRLRDVGPRLLLARC